MVPAALAGVTVMALVGATPGAAGRPEILFRRNGPVVVVLLGVTRPGVVAPVARSNTIVGRGRVGATTIGPQRKQNQDRRHRHRPGPGYFRQYAGDGL